MKANPFEEILRGSAEGIRARVDAYFNRPEFPGMFKKRCLKLWEKRARHKYDSVEMLQLRIELWKREVNPDDLAYNKIPPGTKTSVRYLEELDLSRRFLLALYNGDASFFERILHALRDDRSKVRSHQELAIDLYLRLVESGRAPTSRQEFYDRLKEQFAKYRIPPPKNFSHLLHRIGLDTLWRPIPLNQA